MEESAAELSQQLQDALLTIARCLKRPSLPMALRQTLMRTMDVLSSEWSQLRVDGRLSRSEEEHRVLLTMTEICQLMADSAEQELLVLGGVLERMVDGWVQQHPPSTAPAARKKAEGEPAPPPPQVAAPKESMPPPPPPAATPSVAKPPKAPPPSMPEPAAPEPNLMEEYMRADEEITQGLDEIQHILGKVENTPMPREEAVALLMALSAYQRILWKKAAGLHRNWELDRVRDEIVRVARDKLMGLWLAPGDRNIDFSVEELQLLREGYEALVRSWQMWRWYEKHADDLDKSVGEPLLESIAAPMAMVQQVYYERRLLAEAAAQDLTTTLRDAMTAEVRERNWRLEMLGMRCSLQRQRHFIAKAAAHWELAKNYLERKARQQEALEALEQLMLNPNPETFEEDLLCALVRCHQTQVPPSNLKLRQLMHDYQWLLENPAVPEKCEVSAQERNAARRFLITLGEHLNRDVFSAVMELADEEEAEMAPNAELLRRARDITNGKNLLMVCFAKRTDIEHHLKQELGFTKIDWPDPEVLRVTGVLEARVRHADMVIAVPRYSRSHWKDARDIAQKLGKPFVLASRGLSITHLAQQIVDQLQAG